MKTASVAVNSRISWSGFPIKLLNYMAAGLPVVATRVGGVPELVDPGQTGWLVNPQDAPALAAALAQALANPEASQQMGRAGRQRAIQDFSFKTMVQRYETLLDRLLRQARR